MHFRSFQINSMDAANNLSRFKRFMKCSFSGGSQTAILVDLVNVIKLFLEEIQIPPKLKQQEQAILKAINSFRVQFSLKQYCFHISVLVRALEEALLNFLIWGKSRFPPKKFYNINPRRSSGLTRSRIYSKYRSLTFRSIVPCSSSPRYTNVLS